MCVTETEREENTLLHKDKDLSTSRLFYKSVSDDKHSNTQYVRDRQTDRQTDRETHSFVHSFIHSLNFISQR